MTVLQYVLDISPSNEKALFHYTFCLRALRREKEAIECLTQVSLLSSMSYRLCPIIYVLSSMSYQHSSYCPVIDMQRS